MSASSHNEGPSTDRRGFVTGAAAVLTGGTLAACAQTPRSEVAAGERFEFALIGDIPYNRNQEPEYARLIDELNARDLAFVVHIGDFQFDPRPYERNPASARPPGADATYDYVLQTFNSSRNPLVLTPGDNDWSDLFEMKSLKFDPLERLQYVRRMFYGDGRSLGQRRLALVRQSDVHSRHKAYRENQLWTVGSVMCATFHMVGSNDNVGRTPDMDVEQRQRQAANLDWIRHVFAQARATRSRGLVLITHANPGFENLWPANYRGRYYRPLLGVKAPQQVPESAYDPYIKLIQAEMEGFAAPTLFLHGDTHLHRVDKPLFSAKSQRPFEHFTRVESFGWPDSHWVRIAVDTAQPQVFTVTSQIVAGNRANRMA